MKTVELFPNVTDRSTHSNQPLDRVLRWATTNEKLKAKTSSYRLWLQLNPQATKQEKSAKKVQSFPAITFSGTFTGTGKATDINVMSGLIVIDFDHIPDIAAKYKAIKQDPYTHLLFYSPSNDGFKVVIKHTLTNPDEWKYLYLELESYYLNKYDIPTDPSGKDINRMCFLPFIENLYRNDNSEVWQYSGIPEQQQKPQRTITELNESNEDLYKQCFFISSYLFWKKIDITASYDDWILYGYSLCSLGEQQGRELYNNISCVNPDYDPDETNKQYDYMYSHYDPNRTGIDFFIRNAKTAMADQLLNEKYGFTA